MKTADVITTGAELRARVSAWRHEAARVGLVPTMGALHEGHLSLITEAAKRSDRVVVSIFVNPRQFGPSEDLERYPRNLEHDRGKLAVQDATDVIFVPERGEIYPDGFATEITVGGPACGLESDFRPHFFAGVATVVAKLLITVAPDVAMFGEKDFQQLLVVRRLVGDLGLPVEIVAVPIAREPDGLAMSSRNAYLGPRERRIAGKLNRVLADVAERVRSGASVAAAKREGRDALLAAGFDSVDYVAIRNAHTLAPLQRATADMRILAAATIGGTRLIDNLPV
ncbi:MAG TPA: pantoate--beta-alanine ligase [Rhizomicrobium sp.]|jgi:pantoate--beta-alanine ligase|nr:pantoate--beta-alanine ligase [Rhizomicrobium sp.]